MSSWDPRRFSILDLSQEKVCIVKFQMYFIQMKSWTWTKKVMKENILQHVNLCFVVKESFKLTHLYMRN